MFTQAADSGAKVTMPLMDAFWGDRTGQLIDPFDTSGRLQLVTATSPKKKCKKAQQEWFAELGKGQ